MALESWIALLLLVNLTIYMNLGGADFGARYLELVSWGEDTRSQRALLGRVIGPTYAVNHVLFLMVAGLIFVAFPIAIEVAMGPLLAPVLLLFGSVGIRATVLLLGRRRGEGALQSRAGRALYGTASVVAPLAFGLVLGALASGEIRVYLGARQAWGAAVSSWLTPFGLAFGGFLLSLGSLAAATRVVVATDPGPQHDLMRRRALRCAVAAGALAFGAFLLGAQGAPYLHDGLHDRWWSVPFELLTAGAALGAIYALWRGNDGVAGVLVIAQVTLVIVGWGLAMQPYLIYPDVKVTQGGGTTRSLLLVVSALALGAVLLLVSFFVPGWGLSEATAGSSEEEGTRTEPPS